MMADYRLGHEIPKDVVPKLPAYHTELYQFEGRGNRIPVRIWMIAQAGLWFPLTLLLRKIMSMARLKFMQVSVNFMWSITATVALMNREGLEISPE